MSLLDDFVRVTRSRPCPVCEKSDWCLVDRSNPQDPAVVICQREPSPYPAGETGYKHFLRRSEYTSRRRTRTIQVERAPAQDFPALAKNFQAAITGNGLARLASSLGLTAVSLQRLGTGWASARELDRLDTSCRGRGCWTFPMSNAAGDVIGIRLRSDGGFKYSVKNGASGLFIPSELRHEDTLLIAEGPTDTAALLDLGFSSIGRPSCQEGRRQIQHYLQRNRVPRVIIVADGDGPGQQGAERLAGTIRVYCADVRLIRPPCGIKDARAWLRTGGTHQSVLESIECAALIGLRIQGISYG